MNSPRFSQFSQSGSGSRGVGEIRTGADRVIPRGNFAGGAGLDSEGGSSLYLQLSSFGVHAAPVHTWRLTKYPAVLGDLHIHWFPVTAPRCIQGRIPMFKLLGVSLLVVAMIAGLVGLGASIAEVSGFTGGTGLPLDGKCPAIVNGSPCGPTNWFPAEGGGLDCIKCGHHVSK